MTAAERLVALAGSTGTAGALLLLIGTGATAGAALVNYSQLPTGTAAEHLLVVRSAAVVAASRGAAAEYLGRPAYIQAGGRVEMDQSDRAEVAEPPRSAPLPGERLVAGNIYRGHSAAADRQHASAGRRSLAVQKRKR